MLNRDDFLLTKITIMIKSYLVSMKKTDKNHLVGDVAETYNVLHESLAIKLTTHSTNVYSHFRLWQDMRKLTRKYFPTTFLLLKLSQIFNILQLFRCTCQIVQFCNREQYHGTMNSGNIFISLIGWLTDLDEHSHVFWAVGQKSTSNYHA